MQVDAEKVIDQLLERIKQLEYELAVLSAVHKESTENSGDDK